jgi:hypothetical protein
MPAAAILIFLSVFKCPPLGTMRAAAAGEVIEAR